MRVSITNLALLAIAIAITTASGSVIANRTRPCSEAANASDYWVLDLHSGIPQSPALIVEKRLPSPSQIKNKHVFGVDLPADKSGWIESGEAFSWWKKLGWTSVNPATGKQREHMKLCQKHKEHKIPDDAECCHNDVFWSWCRTYRKMNKDNISESLHGVVTVLNISGIHAVEG